MRLTRLRLTNIACFEDVTLDFTSEETGEPADWVVIVGENGTGKSTLLQVLGAAILGPHLLPSIAGDVNWSRYVRSTASADHSALAMFEFMPEEGDTGYTTSADLWKGTIALSGTDLLGPPGYFFASVDALADSLYSQQPIRGWFGCGYSSWRRSSRRALGAPNAYPIIEEGAKPFRFASLFGDETNLTNVPDWLFGLFYRTLLPNHSSQDDELFRRAIDSVEMALPGIKFIEFDSNRGLVVEEAGTKVALQYLSDGYRGTLAWVGDLIRRLFDAYPDSPDPLKERGVVLVDEIDLHLHPTWQRRIVADIRRLFPNLQFIVTTHSPFVAQDMTERDRLIVLRRKEQDTKSGGRSGPVVAEHANLDVRNWRVDQILTSYLFGLPGTRDDEIVKKEQRLQKLLDKEGMRGSLSPKEQRERDALLLELDGPESQPDDAFAAMAAFAAADAAIAALTGGANGAPRRGRKGGSTPRKSQPEGDGA